MKEKGVFSTPNPKPGKTLGVWGIAESVKDFYNSDEVSRMMPGKRYYVTIRNEHGKFLVQKRLVLANLQEIYVSIIQAKFTVK